MDTDPATGPARTPIRWASWRRASPKTARPPAEGFTTFAPDPTDPNQAAFIAAHHGDSYAVNGYTLGVLTTANPNIKPEKSQSFTIVAIIQPISNLSLSSVDYYHIKKTQVIAKPSPFTALADYYAGVPLPTGYTITLDAPDPLYPKPRPVRSSSARPTSTPTRWSPTASTSTCTSRTNCRTT